MRISTAGIARRGDSFLIALRNPGSSIGESWEFPGGKAEEGEAPDAALVREFREELGVPVSTGALLYEGNFSNKGDEYRLMAFEVELESTMFRLKEHQELRWAVIDELEELPMASSDRQIVLFLKSTV
jgi:8-oxo-dGTP diphosphatase